MKIRFMILPFLLALNSGVAVSSSAQGFVSVSRFGLNCERMFGVFPDYEFDEELGSPHHLQLQFADGTPIGDSVAFECPGIGLLGFSPQSVEGVPPGLSAKVRAVLLDSDDKELAASRVVPIVLGTRLKPANLFDLFWNLDRESATEEPIDSGLCFWAFSEPPVVPGSSEQPDPVFGPRVCWIKFGELFGGGEPWIVHGGLKGPVAWGDLDGDRDLDFITTVPSVGYRCFRQQTDGTFLLSEGNAHGAGANGIALADFDGDDDLDAWFYGGASRTSRAPNTLWLNQGDGRFEAVDQFLGQGAVEVLADDLDGDGDTDVMVFKNSEIAATPGSIDVWKNDGAGHFDRVPSGIRGCDLTSHYGTLADVNGDTFPDLLYLCFGGLGVYLNQGNGRFVASGKGYSIDTGLLGPWYDEDPRVGDFDNDGDLDVLLHNGNIPSTLWFNDGEGTFRFGGALSGFERQRATVADLDGDGDADFAIGRWLYRNSGDCRFSRENSPLPRAFELVDADNDGFEDLLYVDEEGLMLHRGGQLTSESPDQIPGLVIPDIQLRRVIADALDQEFEEPLTALDMARLERLDLSRTTWGWGPSPVRDLTGLAFAVNLEELDFTGADGRPSVDVEEFVLPDSLPKLRTLKLVNNQLKSIRFPSSLPSLETIDLSENSLASVALRGTADRLETLILEKNALNQVHLEGSLSSLRSINLRHNQLTELRLNVGMPELRSINLRDNSLTVVLLPSDAKQLGRIDLTGSSVKELRLPQDASQITELSLSGPWPQDDPSVFGRLKGLKTLGYINGYFDPSQFESLPQLETLSLQGNKVTNFQLPRGYENLRLLILSSSVMQSFELPDDLHRLQRVFFVLNHVAELSVPEGLVSLESLSVGNTPISELQLRSDMRQLSSIHISNKELLRFVAPVGVGEDSGGRLAASIESPRLRHVTLPEGWTTTIPKPLISLNTFEPPMRQRGQFRISSAHRLDVVIERSRDLRAWEPVRTYREFSGERTFQDTELGEESQMFYRIRKVDP